MLLAADGGGVFTSAYKISPVRTDIRPKKDEYLGLIQFYKIALVAIDFFKTDTNTESLLPYSYN